MLDSRTFDSGLLTPAEMDAHAKVHAYKMRKAEVVRKVIGRELGGSVPVKGRRYLTVGTERWRVAMESGSDNSTEVAAHGLVGVVCVFGDPPKHALSLAQLYARYGHTFDEKRFEASVKTELSKVWP
jgi:hypothetical protein